MKEQQPYSLVTGANGFLGATLVRKLLERGERVKAFVRPETDLSALEGYSQDQLLLSVGNVLSPSSVYRALTNVKHVYHTAANFKLWDKHPKSILEPSVIGTRHVLEAAKARGVEKIVVTSSVAVLGTTQEEEMDETHEFNLSDPELYVQAKVQAAEVVAEAVEEGQHVVSVLPGTMAGPGDRKPTPNGQLLIRYLKHWPSLPFPVVPGGLNVVDVEDVALGHILAMEKGVSGERYILGGDNLTFKQIFETLADITGLAEPTAPNPIWAHAMRFLRGDKIMTSRIMRDYVGSNVWVTSARAESELGYQHRSAREALARSVRWFLDNGYVSEQAASRVRLELRPV